MLKIFMLLHGHFIGTACGFRKKKAFIDCGANREVTYGKALAASLRGESRLRDERKILKRMSEHLPSIALPREFALVEELRRREAGKWISGRWRIWCRVHLK